MEMQFKVTQWKKIQFKKLLFIRVVETVTEKQRTAVILSVKRLTLSHTPDSKEI